MATREDEHVEQLRNNFESICILTSGEVSGEVGGRVARAMV